MEVGSSTRPAAEAADAGPDDPASRAEQLAERTRTAEGMAADIRRRRDEAIVAAIEAGWTTRALGSRLGLTASQVSAIWRREHPPRPRRVSSTSP